MISSNFQYSPSLTPQHKYDEKGKERERKKREEAKSPFVLMVCLASLDLALCLDLPELLTIGQNNVHVLESSQ